MYGLRAVVVRTYRAMIRALEVEDRNADDAADWAHNLEPGENEAEARRE